MLGLLLAEKSIIFMFAGLIFHFFIPIYEVSIKIHGIENKIMLIYETYARKSQST